MINFNKIKDDPEQSLYYWKLCVLKNSTSQRLIEFVEANPCIWNREDEGYSDKATKDKAWVSICTELDPGFVELPKKKQHETRQQITKRWNNIRNAYRKYLKRNCKKRPYLYANYLTFLDPTYITIKKGAKESDGDENTENFEVTWLEDDEELSDSNIMDKDEADDLFLKSLLPSIKSLKDDTKLDFKIKLIKLLKDFKAKDKQPLKRKASEDLVGNGLGELESD